MEEIIRPELPGLKVHQILRFSAALLNTPCPLCQRSLIDERDVTLHIGHHQIPCCKDCLPKAAQILQLAVQGVVDDEKELVKRHESRGMVAGAREG